MISLIENQLINQKNMDLYVHTVFQNWRWFNMTKPVKITAKVLLKQHRVVLAENNGYYIVLPVEIDVKQGDTIELTLRKVIKHDS